MPVRQPLDEETARAEIYGVLATLWYAPPDAEWLARLRAAVDQVFVPLDAVLGSAREVAIFPPVTGG
ncbi:MAG: MoaD/ThiS family protein [Pseudomonadota bacterium]